ncbi:MAG: hypothetical protein COT81_03850 [Candidatus Buchananbacteria bacterium CG10_big_fil_rev_8_21_14_0_10_42_9]|uniref:Prepilin-type N-terminal cleavage/methylation domain-containing protein n=1 Tax=Candidatus Buchananbacteria bacterium CG10_big_fil_rev_8_21_14_0_10_42_9 TaxID=1974526 RepID=A0A2H0W0L9_9BACT|nr:MAG: hypothetical protein COT81_03850 [Candidatus Buchananbacteria bacterium CG10_big_fil_rev_8_21_14_0_10_42_9]
MIEDLRPREGFTLIEMLIYVALIAASAVIFTSFVVDVIDNSARIITVKEVHQNSRLILARLSQEIKTAKDFSGTFPGESIQLTRTDDTVITLAYDNLTNAVTLDGAPISSDEVRVTALTFDNNVSNVIEIDLTVEQGNPNANVERNYLIDLSTAATVRRGIY